MQGLNRLKCKIESSVNFGMFYHSSSHMTTCTKKSHWNNAMWDIHNIFSYFGTLCVTIQNSRFPILLQNTESPLWVYYNSTTKCYVYNLQVNRITLSSSQLKSKWSSCKSEGLHRRCKGAWSSQQGGATLTTSMANLTVSHC